MDIKEHEQGYQLEDFAFCSPEEAENRSSNEASKESRVYDDLSIFEIEQTDPSERVCDPKRVIKKYSREINAGTNYPRSPEVLLNCVLYMTNEILDAKPDGYFSKTLAKCSNPNVKIYNFCSDRFRAVLQDLTINGDSSEETIACYQKMVYFYIDYGVIMLDWPDFPLTPHCQLLSHCLVNLNTCHNQSGSTNQSEFLGYLLIVAEDDPLWTIELLKSTEFEVAQVALKALKPRWKRNEAEEEIKQELGRLEKLRILIDAQRGWSRRKLEFDQIKKSIKEIHTFIIDSKPTKKLKFKIRPETLSKFLPFSSASTHSLELQDDGFLHPKGTS
ncbi:unnamed protein product [Moneuplotes crassus]|uniref:SAC3/GANP/THP3 conserved domain-containing protein n=1 Tax=Euplotes crassus TaxID=5936 RepID=A0AAD1XGM5_EUPCR|nr:unnamed protein product [Moneuplotes crassus]